MRSGNPEMVQILYHFRVFEIFLLVLSPKKVGLGVPPDCTFDCTYGAVQNVHTNRSFCTYECIFTFYLYIRMYILILASLYIFVRLILAENIFGHIKTLPAVAICIFFWQIRHCTFIHKMYIYRLKVYIYNKKVYVRLYIRF